MWINFSDIPDTGLQLDIKESTDEVQWKAQGIDLCGVLEFAGRLDKLENEILVRGSLKAMVGLVCARCVTSFRLPISSRVEVEYRLKIEEPPEENLELEEEDINTYFCTQNRLDLGQAFRDQIFLSIPIKPLCKDTCKGLCSTCGANLNEGTCGCSAESIDPRLEVLKALNKDIQERN